ncbi:MAG: MFS transporter [Treponema sp.]|jgi:GPH family glycoside/pentoside/hexuronide:cation symporter|nr:MFS transporter [Treponema sp.]
MAQKKLSVGQKLGFGIFDLGGNMLFTLMGFWCLKYLTDVAGLAAAMAGAAVMIGKAWDAVTDPMMGFISDRTITRLGRRRPYLLIGAIPMMLTLWFFFTAPAISGQVLLILWATVALMLVNTASTVINVPYSSLTPELTDDYHERSVLNGYRFGCAVFGTIAGAAAVLPLAGAFGGEKHGWSMMGLILGAVMALVTLLTFFGTKEKKHSREDIPKESFFSTYKAVFTNKPYVILFMTYALHMTAITFLQSILAYYIEYIYPTEFVMRLGTFPLVGNPAAAEAALRETLTVLAMMGLLLTAMVFIPVSVLVSKKIGKKHTYQICFAVMGSACIAVSAIGHLLPLEWFLGLLAYAGIGVGFSYVAPFAMVPDTVEFDAVNTGIRKEGAYYGMWTFISKCGTALSVFISGFILNMGGYVANAVQIPSARFAIRLIIGPIPAIVFLVAIILVQFYPLDEKTYKKFMGQQG